MEKIARFLPLGLLSLLSLKLIVLGASISDSLTLLILALTSAYYEFKTENKRILVIERRLATHEVEKQQRNDEIESLKGLLGGIKLGQQMKKF